MYNKSVLILKSQKEAIFSMKFLKRAAALLMSLTMLGSATGCGEDTAYAMNIDGMDVRAGLYIYYAVNAYQDAMNVLRDGGKDFSEMTTTEEIAAVMKESNIDGKTAEEWIQNKAAQYCADYVAVEREFEKQGLTLTGEQLAAIASSAEGSQQFFGAFFKGAGIGEESIKAITRSTYQQNALWDKYYGEGGIKDIKDEDLYDNYAKNHLRIKYISMPLKDGEGNLLKADGKEVIQQMADDYLARLAKKQGNEAALMKEMDFLIDEHNNYVTSLSEAAVTTTDESGNLITTPTTAKLTTDIYGNTATTTESTDESGESGETTESTSIAGEDGTTAETTGETTTTETTASAEGEGEGEGDETTSAATTETTGTTSEEPTTTTTEDTSYDTAKERILVVSTSATDELKAKETTTTAAPTYTPCEVVYNWAADDATTLLKPELIKDEECWYIVIKMDIKDRMTAEDLWTANQVESTRQDLYYEEFQDMIEKWGDALTVNRNEKAFRRYKVLDIDVMGYQNAMMQSYYSAYGLSY